MNKAWNIDLGEEWCAAMRAENFARAWLISDAVLQHAPVSGRSKHTGPRHLQRIWCGDPLDNCRVLVRCYHGLGDTIQFVRFIEHLARVARDVTVWCQRELLNLLSSLSRTCQLLPLHDGTPEVDYDVDIEIMELPYALRIMREEISSRVPYLTGRVNSRKPAKAGLQVGLAWQVSGWDPDRRVELSAFAPVAAVPHVKLLALQPVDGARDFAIDDGSSPSIDDLAKRMLELDLVIAVDGMPAHLAGALGVPVWTLLQTTANWRWGTGSSTVWYPTMRLFRQSEPGRWDQPIMQAADALRELAIVRKRTWPEPR